MFANIMAEMRKKSLLRTNRFRQCNSFVERDVGNVWFMPERIQYQYFKARQLLQRFPGQCFYIGKIGYLPNPVTQHRQTGMHRPQWNYLRVADRKRSSIDRVQLDVRHTGISLFGETIGHGSVNGANYILFGIHLHIS